MGGYLSYVYVFVCGNCLAKTYCFLHSIGQLAMPKFFSAKCMFVMAPTKEYRKNLKKNFTFTHTIKDSHYLAQWYNDADTDMHTRQADLFNLISH